MVEAHYALFDDIRIVAIRNGRNNINVREEKMMSEIATSILNTNTLLYGGEKIEFKNLGPSCVDMKGESGSTNSVKPQEAPIKAVREK